MTCLPVIKATSDWVQNGGKYLVYTDQAAVIKAIKEGKTNVDLNAPTTPDNTPGGGSSTTEGGGSGNTEGGSGNTEGGGSNTGQTGSDGQGSESGSDGNMG